MGRENQQGIPKHDDHCTVLLIPLCRAISAVSEGETEVVGVFKNMDGQRCVLLRRYHYLHCIAPTQHSMGDNAECVAAHHAGSGTLCTNVHHSPATPDQGLSGLRFYHMKGPAEPQ